MICFGLVWMYTDKGEVFFKYGRNEDSFIDPGICEVLKFWKCSMASTIMVPCQVELDDEKNYRLSLPSEMVDECNRAKEERAKNEEMDVVAAQDLGTSGTVSNIGTSNRDILFAEIRSLSNRSRILHKDDYPFVISAFAAQGLQQTPPHCVLYYSRRLGLFHLLKSALTEGGGCDFTPQYIRGIVDSPFHFSYLQGIAQPESAKSVKIVKTAEIIFKGCALLGYVANESDVQKAEKWIGWNDATGLLTFDFACTRLLKQKHSDFDYRCAFVMFSATLTRNGKWKVKEISYSRQEIVENESQMPQDIFFVDGLTIAHKSLTEIKLISTTMKTDKDEELVVICKRERLDASETDERAVYGAIIVPVYPKGPANVQFEAIAVLPRHKWVDPDSQYHRLSSILPTWEENEMPVVSETSYSMDLEVQQGYL